MILVGGDTNVKKHKGFISMKIAKLTLVNYHFSEVGLCLRFSLS